MVKSFESPVLCPDGIGGAAAFYRAAQYNLCIVICEKAKV